MKRFKQWDVRISMMLITVLTIISLIKLDETFIYAYFIVGGWQCISMLTHRMNNWFMEKGGVRSTYHWIVLILFIITGLGFAVPYILFIILYLMLFAAPVMAIYYTVFCYEEVYIKMKRPLSDIR